MPRNPDVYARLLGEKLEAHDATVYGVNTGWSGGPYGVGSRMDITQTRAMVAAAISGALLDVECEPDPVFKVLVPKTCPGVDDPAILNPINTWADKDAYRERARKLAADFAAHFESAYGDKGIDPAIAAECPGV